MKEQFDIILNDYLKDNSIKINYKTSLRELQSQIEYILQDDNFIVKASHGQISKVECPCICIFHKNITTTENKGIYICYLFRSDKSGFYLTLNQGITFFEEQYGTDKYVAASKTTDYFKKEVYSNIFQSEIIDLRNGDGQTANEYNHTTIISKFYSFDSYTEEELISDLKHMICIYKQLYKRIEYITYEQLVDLVVNGNKEMLENTDAKFILKLHQEMYLLQKIADLYHVDRKELDKIRKQKGLGDIIFENSLQDIITIVKHLDILLPNIEERIRGNIIRALISGYIHSHGHKALYTDKFFSYDWSKNNIDKLILEKEIDLAYRNAKLSDYYKKFKRILDDYMKEINEKIESVDNKIKEIHYTKVERKSSIQTTSTNYPRNNRISANAIRKAEYFCEIDKTHPSFIKRSTHRRYMEPHHLIPLEYQDQFKYSLDIEANIISLCSNCHNEIHYGTENKKMIEKLYEERKESLKKCGIVLDSKEQLYSFYNRYEITKEETNIMV